MEPHHHHEHSHRLTSLNKAFIIGIALNITFVIVEFGVGFYYNSLGLLSDAGHNLGDVASLVLAMLAFRLEKVHPNSRYTYGYKKSTILVSLLNAVILLVAVGIIIAESIDKLFHPVSVDGSAIAWTVRHFQRKTHTGNSGTDNEEIEFSYHNLVISHRKATK